MGNTSLKYADIDKEDYITTHKKVYKHIYTYIHVMKYIEYIERKKERKKGENLLQRKMKKHSPAP